MPPRNATPGTRVYRLLVRVGSLVGTGGGRRAGSSEAARAVVNRDPRSFLRLRAMLLAIQITRLHKFPQLSYADTGTEHTVTKRATADYYLDF